MEELIIVGGGIAGLSCLNHLNDQGTTGILIEGNKIGSPKICGEFIAPLALPFLEKWGISNFETIHSIHFNTANKNLHVNLTRPAGAFSRSQAELLLAKRAISNGAEIRENCRINKIEYSKRHFKLILSDGTVLQTKNLISATGKVGLHSKTKPINSDLKEKYTAIKMHFSSVIQAKNLTLYSLPGTYFGVIPISSAQSNLACLIETKLIPKGQAPHDYLINLLNKIFPPILLNKLVLTKDDWLVGKLNKFGTKLPNHLSCAFKIGDAISSFEPAIGYGFAHSVLSGVMGADFYLKQDLKNYNKSITKSIYKYKILAKMMHYLLLHPGLGYYVFPYVQRNIWLSQFILKQLMYV